MDQATTQRWKEASVQSLMSLSAYAAKSNISILVENHGGLSSNAGLLMEVIHEVNLYQLWYASDFGNFCIGQTFIYRSRNIRQIQGCSGNDAQSTSGQCKIL